MPLFFAPRTRSIRAIWVLEEAGAPYSLHPIDLRSGENRKLGYLAINPAGKVPALVDDTAIVSESAAICAYVADKHFEAGLAPSLGAPERGPYLRWMFYSVSCIEPAYITFPMARSDPSPTVPWGSVASISSILTETLAERPYILGDRFTAADIMVGSLVLWGLSGKILPSTPVLESYAHLLEQRPARQRAVDFNSHY